MTDIFLKLLNMSFTASFLIIAVLILRLVLKKVPKWTICLLWGMVAVRLICPFSLESALSLVPNANPIPANIEYMAEPQIESGIPIVDAVVNPVILDSFAPEQVVSVNPLQIWVAIATVVWGIGLVVMLIYAGISYMRIYRTVKASIPRGRVLTAGVNDSPSGAEGSMQRVNGFLSTENKIYICDDIDMPFILGILKPRIYLPSGMDGATEKYVIAHEESHLKRKDHWWKPLGFLLLSIYWFNPLIWIGYTTLCRDIEIACDEKVVRDMSLEGKKEYSMALLTCSASRRMIAACPLAFGEVGVKERIKSVLNYRKPSFWVIAGGVAVLLAVMLFFMTDPASEEVQYIDLKQLRAITESTIQDVTFEDRHFVCEKAISNELEQMVHDLYYYQITGEFDKRENLIGANESLKIGIRNEKKHFQEGIYMSEYRLHDLQTLTAGEVQKLPEEAKEDLHADMEAYGLMEYAIVRLDVSWIYNEKYYSMGPQLDNGRYIRYYLLGAVEDSSAYKIYELYWGEYWGDVASVTATPEAQPTILQVMDRILSAVPLEEALPLTTTANLPQEDQLYFLDATENGKYSLYGFHSDEFGYSGMLINYKIDGEDNWNYLDDITNWIGYEFPRIAETEDGALLLTYCYNGGTGAHVDRFFCFQPHETGTLSRYELTIEAIKEQTESLAAFALDSAAEEVQVFSKESGSEQLFALLPYKTALNGQELQIKDVDFYYERVKFLTEPALLIVGIGLKVEESIQPLMIGELAFHIKAEPEGDGYRFLLYNVSTYESGVIKELQLEDGVNSEEEAVALVQKQLIVAYENKYGAYNPSDEEVGLYSDDASRLAFIIPRLSVSDETEDYYVIPVVWDFRVYKESGEVTVYYNGIDPFEYTFDPTNPAHLAFAG